MNNNVKYGVILEARMGSSRLPGKTLMDMCGEPLIRRVVDRIKCSKIIDKIVLATTTSSKDDILVDYMNKIGIDVFRGSEDNVLERVVLASEKYHIKNIIELHGDNPFLDPEIIDLTINKYELTNCDYISNTLNNSFPMGLRVQVFPTKLLRDIYNTVDDSAVNEHVSPYFYENPDIFKIENVNAPSQINRPDIRLTVDTEEDFQFVSNIYKEIIFKDLYPNFKTTEVLKIIDENKLPLINKNVLSKPIRVID
jgi:spore coat polysaccharide biosynthesis protein SpsF